MEGLCSRAPETGALDITIAITRARPSSDLVLLTWHEGAWGSGTMATHKQGKFAIEGSRGGRIYLHP
jgi:hypothetical protein